MIQVFLICTCVVCAGVSLSYIFYSRLKRKIVSLKSIRDYESAKFEFRLDLVFEYLDSYENFNPNSNYVNNSIQNENRKKEIIDQYNKDFNDWGVYDYSIVSAMDISNIGQEGRHHIRNYLASARAKQMRQSTGSNDSSRKHKEPLDIAFRVSKLLLSGLIKDTYKAREGWYKYNEATGCMMLSAKCLKHLLGNSSCVVDTMLIEQIINTGIKNGVFGKFLTTTKDENGDDTYIEYYFAV